MEFFVLYIIVLLIVAIALGSASLFAWIIVDILGKFFSLIFSEYPINESNDIS